MVTFENNYFMDINKSHSDLFTDYSNVRSGSSLRKNYLNVVIENTGIEHNYLTAENKHSRVV